MRLLLKEDVGKLGRRGDMVDVKAGYARNYLLPQGMGIAVTQRNLTQIERAKAKILKEEAEKRARLEDLGQMLSQVACTITVKATDDGHLYGSVGPREVVEAMAAVGHTLKQEEIALEEHIKEVGLFKITANLDQDVKTEIRVWIVPEREEESPT